jgi:hypothetical protein
MMATNRSRAREYRTVHCVLLAAALAGGVASCSDGADFGPGEDPESGVGTVVLSLAQVPEDVLCTRITVTGTRTVVRAFDTTPAGPSVFRMGGLPPGEATFLGEAFPSVCAAIGPDSLPNWISDPIPVVVSAVVENLVSLSMRRNGRATVTLDFLDPSAACSQPGTTCLAANLTGGAVVPPTTSTSIGRADVVLQGSSATIHLTHNMTGVISQHLHGPASTTTNANSVCSLGVGNDVTFICQLGGNFPLAMRGGAFYVDVHTAELPNGAIRGQILALPPPP